MKPKTYIVRLAFLAAVCLGLLSCSREEQEASFSLYYASLSNIGPSMNYTTEAPTWKGAEPSSFAVAAVRLDGERIDCPSISINANTGAISITDTENLTVGTYTVDVSCVSAGVTRTIPEAFTMYMIQAIPDAEDVKVKLEEGETGVPVVNIDMSDMKTSAMSRILEITGESVSVSSLELVQKEGFEYFTISNKGVISVNKNFKGQYVPGVYSIDVKVITPAGEMVYPDVMKVNITSLPVSLTYLPAEIEVETGRAYTSDVPAYVGSVDDLQFSLSAVEPATDKITVDASTAVVTLGTDNGFVPGENFTLSVKAVNKYGETEFSNVLKINIVAFIPPIDPETFKYDAATTIQGAAVTAKPDAGLVGGSVQFALETVPAELEGLLSIDILTGEITLPKGSDVPVGDYSVVVKASNIKGEATTTLNIHVKENPFWFTKILYGNNLGIDPETNANQYWYDTADKFAAASLVPTTDVKDGVQLEWSVKVLHQCSDTAIDASTGQLTLASGGFKANNGGLVLVTATAGKGEEGETSVTVPVFFSFLQEKGGVFVKYAPFVMQANPRKGGKFNAPEITGVDPVSNFRIDFRRTFNYYNFNGPDIHVSGTLNKNNTNTFIYNMWKEYYSSIGGAVNAGAKLPVSIWDKDAKANTALAYFSKENYAIVVNPEKWKYDGAYANGAFIGQATYLTNGSNDNTAISNGSQIFPVWIWFDERF